MFTGIVTDMGEVLELQQRGDLRAPLLEALRAALAPEGHKGEIAAQWLSD